MSTTHFWEISQLECYPEHNGKTNVVFNVRWRRKATDGTHTADDNGWQTIALDPNASFTPYADLTADKIIGWVEKAMGAGKVAELDAALDAKIEAYSNPPIVRPNLPWVGV